MAPRRRASPPPSNSSYDYLLKIILLGPSGSGKSSLLHFFLHNAPLHLASQTIGVEFATKILTLGPKRIKLQIWDTAGTERFRSVSRSYYRGAAGAVLVYDVRDAASFADAEVFLRDARALGSRALGVVAVGNKIDGEAEAGGGGEAGSVGSEGAGWDEGGGEREVGVDAARAWAAAQRIPVCVETSARTGVGVEDVFVRLARMILTKIELGEVNPDDPGSGIQYGDAGGWGVDAADGRSVKSGMTVDDGGSLVGYSGQRRRRPKQGFTLGGWDGFFGGRRAGCC